MQEEPKQQQEKEDITKPVAKAATEAPQGKYRWQFFQTPSHVEVRASMHALLSRVQCQLSVFRVL